MIRIHALLLLAVLLASAIPAGAEPYCGDDRYGLLPIVGVEFYEHSQSGSQAGVRMYNGNNFSIVDIGTLRLEGYTPGLWGNYRGYDLFSGNSNQYLTLNEMDLVSFRARYWVLTHRLEPIPVVDPTQPGDSFTLLDPNRTFQFNRAFTEAKLGITPFQRDWLRLAGEFFSITQDGSQQLLFRSRSNGQRFQARQFLDRTMSASALGVDLGNWGQAFNYRHTDSRFGEHAAPPTFAAQDPVVPIKDITPDTQTEGNTYTSRQDVSGIMRKWIDRKGSGTWYTDQYSTKIRKNLSARSSIRTAQEPVKSADLPNDPAIRIRQYNASLTHLHGRNLMVTGRYRHLNVDNQTPLLQSPTGPLNQVVKRHGTALGVDVTYTGLPRMTLRSSYDFSREHRDIAPVHEVHEEFSHGPIAKETERSVLRLGATARPFTWATFSARVRTENADRPAFNGMPGRSWDGNADLTLSLCDQVVLLGSYSNVKQKNVTVAPPGPGSITNPNFPEIRDGQGGAQYNNNVTTLDGALWASPWRWLNIDVHAGQVSVHSRAFWVLGTDGNFLPIIEQPEYVPYDVRNIYLSAAMTARISKRWLLRANMMHSDSRGQVTTFSLYSKVPDPNARISRISPVDVRNSCDTVGVQYEINRSLRLLLENSWTNWRDHVEAANSGHFQLLSFGVWWSM